MSLTRRSLIGGVPGALLALREMRGEAAKRRHMKQRWDHRKVIVVENRAGKEWNQAVEFVAGEWHRIFPRLRFKVIHRPKKRCGVRKGAIVICRAPLNPWYGGFSWTNHDKREITSANIRIVRTGAHSSPGGFYWGAWNEHLSWLDMHNLCHEFGHAIGLEHYEGPAGSCLANPLSTAWITLADTTIQPSAYDAESLRLLYSKRGPGWP